MSHHSIRCSYLTCFILNSHTAQNFSDHPVNPVQEFQRQYSTCPALLCWRQEDGVQLGGSQKVKSLFLHLRCSSFSSHFWHIDKSPNFYIQIPILLKILTAALSHNRTTQLLLAIVKDALLALLSISNPTLSLDSITWIRAISLILHRRLCSLLAVLSSILVFRLRASISQRARNHQPRAPNRPCDHYGHDTLHCSWEALVESCWCPTSCGVVDMWVVGYEVVWCHFVGVLLKIEL